MEHLRLTDFIYDLPPEAIAQQPVEKRDASRVLVRQTDGRLTHATFGELPNILPVGALLVVNDSKVVPARILGFLESGRPFELFLLERQTGRPDAAQWKAIGKPARHFREGLTLDLGSGLRATLGVIPRGQHGPQPFEVTFSLGPEALNLWLEQHGYIPLPPYIERHDPEPAAASADRERYQTVYASLQGSVAAPTAGLHFTPELLAKLADRGIFTASITLHVGGGTFLPVKTEDPDEHVMHSEQYHVSAATLEQILLAKAENRPVICVGTTSLRCLTSLWLKGSRPETLRASTNLWHSTNLFLRPRQRSERIPSPVANALITNFHQPGSTLFMLVASLIGLDAAQDMYALALKQGYRFLSYGDGSLLWL
jgi:S-adenosylmethionine:tRNA ribosyltransferase-isomerase